MHSVTNCYVRAPRRRLVTSSCLQIRTDYNPPQPRQVSQAICQEATGGFEVTDMKRAPPGWPRTPPGCLGCPGCLSLDHGRNGATVTSPMAPPSSPTADQVSVCLDLPGLGLGVRPRSSFFFPPKMRAASHLCWESRITSFL